MVLIDNINFLTERFPQVWKGLREYQETVKEEPICMETAKNGSPTLYIEKGHKKLYLHSKYDPAAEAEKFIAQFKEVEKYKHVFFYGVGLGYHIEAFMKKYPEMEFSLYEPSPVMMLHYLSQSNLRNLPLKKLKNIYCEFSPADLGLLLKDFTDFIQGNVLLISLPSYERIFSEKFQAFANIFAKTLADKSQNLRINFAYEKRWITNSLVNLELVLKTPNILWEKREVFKDRPVLLAAAGPSLSEELANIRYIKENGLAYIFTVGSAVNALVNNGIIPDATLAHDPSPLCIKVFEKIIEGKKDNFPLIFGSSIASDVVQNYHGPKLHMIINQDTFSPFYLRLKSGDRLEVLNDAPSIAAVALQLLLILGCNPIILAGQNLSYKDNRVYAAGINYDHTSSEVEEEKLKKALKVEDVYGGEVYTTDAFNRMRAQMEYYIRLYPGREIINTTKGGARINGAPFIPLEEVIRERLKERVVAPNWFVGYENSNSYDLEFFAAQHRKLREEAKEAEKILIRVTEYFQKMKRLSQQRNQNQLERMILKFDKDLKRLLRNEYYQLVLKPMARMELELLAKKNDEIKFEEDLVVKAERIVEDYGRVFDRFKEDMAHVTPYFAKLDTIIPKDHHEL